MITSDEVSTLNKEFVKTMIKGKNGSMPYYSSGPSVMNDVDHFPYTRFYRGDVESDKAIIWDREAGYKQRHDHFYTRVEDVVRDTFIPNNCWQMAPSTQLPVNPEALRLYANKAALSLQLDRACVTEYR